MQAAGEVLSQDGLEKLMDGFEKAKHDVMERKQTEWQRQGPNGQLPPPDKIEPSVLYPVSSALRVSTAYWQRIMPSCTI